MICKDCGKKMKEKVVRKGGHYRSRIVRFYCACGFETAGESLTERLENDRLDEEVEEKMKIEKNKHKEPFVEPDEI